MPYTGHCYGRRPTFVRHKYRPLFKGEKKTLSPHGDYSKNNYTFTNIVVKWCKISRVLLQSSVKQKIRGHNFLTNLCIKTYLLSVFVMPELGLGL
jgi:hypothetical protein